ncbi:MAG: hypothetical protein AAB792_02230 [Patescibacteria group bacterium]
MAHPVGVRGIEESIKKNVLKIGRILTPLGFKLDDYQPHINGERKLKSLSKLVLVGTDVNGRKVIIKTSNKASEKKRILAERKIGQELKKLTKATRGLLIPEEILFTKRGGFSFFITQYIEQPKVFVAHSLKEQIKMIKRGLEDYEKLDLKTSKKILGKKSLACPIVREENYKCELNKQIKLINSNYRDNKLKQTLEAAKDIFNKNSHLIPRFSHYLVHEDFCPHNFRVNNKKIYTLDHTAINFGNKYLARARFLNYMVIHNPTLEQKLVRDLERNSTPDEARCLQLFRIYKTVFLIMYYVKTSQKTSGKLLKLTKLRINFWHNFLTKLIQDKTLTKAELADYIQQRDSLRSGEEKNRQREFAIA